MTAYNLNQLRIAADDICIGSTVRCRCYESRKYETDNGDIGYAVIIDEASPEDFKMQKLIQDKLSLAGFHNVEVVTEW